MAKREALDENTFLRGSPREHPLLFFFSSIIRDIFRVSKNPIQKSNQNKFCNFMETIFIYSDNAFNPLRVTIEKQEVIRRDFP